MALRISYCFKGQPREINYANDKFHDIYEAIAAEEGIDLRAYLAMEDACMAADICAVHYGKDDISKAKTRDYREADGYRKEAQRSLYDMLEGIRDNYLADQCPTMPDDDDEA